ncbi:MAG: carbon-nitrogen hydrolase family protein [Gammaproteobacteria bacterium]
MTRVAVIQMVSSADVETNLAAAAIQLEQAARGGATLAVLPENFAFLGRHDTDRVKLAEPAGSGPVQDFLAAKAAEHAMWIVAGTIPLKCKDVKRVKSACLVYDTQGNCVARYDKVHLFDVEIPGSNESYSESASTVPGQRISCVDTSAGRLGLAVCYDLRFPELFRALLDESATLIALPAAFTAQTGEAHWDTLVRARAVENQVFMLAAAQGGKHENGRTTWGHSMIVDPWGNVLDSIASGPGIVIADLDLPQQQEIRRRFPVLTHRRNLNKEIHL